jgi:hypothetical protein
MDLYATGKMEAMYLAGLVASGAKRAARSLKHRLRVPQACR